VIDKAGPGTVGRFGAAIGQGLLILDAAMGTRLMALGLDDDDPCLWNLSHPDAVAAIHRADVEAGAAALLTNTFGANRSWLARFGRADDGRVAAINRSAVALARQAAGPDRFVIGDLGPTAADGGTVAEQAMLLIEAGVDALILETYRIDQAEAALRQLAGSGAPRVPVLVSLFVWPDPPDEAVARLTALGASALGANCQDGMAVALEQAGRIRRATPLPLIVKPSAGRPGRPTEGPETFAHAVPRLRSLAPVLAGGCCGTTEAHVAALRAAWYDTES
jgi:5-methyltetrahydrofolate--homocysteine methyltransferase